MFFLFAGIPVNQQHLLYNQEELSDTVALKDIPVYDGIRLKLVLGMKVGPIQSARRVLPSLSDYDSWFDINDVMQNSKYTECDSFVNVMMFKHFFF